jgi:predicted transcriptional regulator of viral defense system
MLKWFQKGAEMYTLLKPLPIRGELLKRGVGIFTPQDFQRIFRTTESRTKYFLEEYTKGGLFLRLKNGLYMLKTDPPPEEEIANRLYRPSYISFEYALGAYSILLEMAYAVTSATTQPTRTFQVGERTFSYFTIKKEAFTGYIPVKRGGRTVLMAEPEKALVDYLYFVSLGKKPKNDRLNTVNLDKQKVLSYASLCQRTGLDKLLQEVL